MPDALKTSIINGRLIYLIGGLFALLNAVLVGFEFYYASLLPVLLCIVLLALFALDKLVLLVVFLTPLSVNLTDIGLGVGLSLPTDPLLFGVMLMFVLKLITERSFDKRISDHPVTLAIIINLVWIGITTATSEMPIVSLKYLVSRLWYVITFYFVATQVFRKFNNIRLYVAMYVISFVGVIGYTIIHHGCMVF